GRLPPAAQTIVGASKRSSFDPVTRWIESRELGEIAPNQSHPPAVVPKVRTFGCGSRAVRRPKEAQSGGGFHGEHKILRLRSGPSPDHRLGGRVHRGGGGIGHTHDHGGSQLVPRGEARLRPARRRRPSRLTPR